MIHLRGMTFRILALLLAFPALLAAPVPAPAGTDMVELRILPGWRQADGTHLAALKVSLAEGWKTYWRAPGEAGIPPRFDWSGSDNLAGVEVEWPTPHQTVTNGMRTIGYAQDLVLPLRLTPQQEGQPIRLRAEVEIGVCRDICVPVTRDLAQDLPPDRGAPDPQIAAALAARPYSASEAGVTRVTCRIQPIEGGLRVLSEVDMPVMGREEIVVLETANPSLWVAQSESRRTGNRLHSETDIFHVEGRGFLLDRAGLRLTILSRGDAVDIRGCPAG